MDNAPHLIENLAVRQKEFAEEMDRVRVLLGVGAERAAYDAVMDAAGFLKGASTLAADGEMVVRLAPTLGEAQEGFAPSPRDAWWGVLRAGSAKVSVARQNAKGTGSKETFRTVEIPVVERGMPVQAWLVSKSSKRFLLAAGGSRDRDLVIACAEAVARAMQINVDLEGAAPADSSSSPEGESALADQTAPTVDALGRFGFRPEGQRWVLRDYASVSPKSGARRDFMVALGFVVPALVAWGFVFQQGAAGASTNLVLGVGVLAALLSLAAFAFLGVARFAAKYSARSQALFWVAGDHYVVAPWVARDGAIDVRREGRLGAAIKCKEYKGISVVPRAHGFAVEIDSAHGPTDVISVEDELEAERLRSVLSRRLEEMAPVPASKKIRGRATSPGAVQPKR